MSKETIKVVEINTDPAKKSIKDLRKELLELKNQMANLEEGGDEFLEIANKAGELKHQLDEINESVKGASADFGDMVGNITNVAAGLTGAFQAVAGGLQAMGLESKAIDETIKRMQGLMAVTQGLSAIDDGIKSFGKLTKAIQGSTGAMKVFKAISNPVALAAISAVVVTIGAAWSKWGDELRKSIPALDEFIKKFDGTAAKEAERIAEAQRKFNEELAVSNEEVAKILEERKLSKLTQEGREELKRLQDDLKIAENELLQFQERLNEAGNNKTLWNSIREEARITEEKILQLKRAILSIYTDPKYSIVNQSIANQSTTTPKREGYNDGLTLGSITPLQTTPLSEVDNRDIGTRLGNILAEAEIKARNKKWKEEVENINNAGNEVFEQLKSSMDMFTDSSLGLTSGWIAGLDEFQLAFQQTMAIVKDEGTVSWTAYGNVAATALGGIGTMLNALSNEQDASNEKGFEQMKNLQIAATVMNMLSGVMSAWTSAMSPANAWMTVAGQIAMGTVMSAMIAGIGGAQIAKIKSQTMTSANPNTNINAKSVSSMIVPPVQYSNAVQGAELNGNIQNTKVYVLESEISNVSNAIKTQVDENTY